jgi:3-oxoadipate enol-lactonase
MTSTGRLARDGYVLRYVAEGQGERCFVCLHGLVDDLSIWDRVAPRLVERGLVLRLDQRGHGGSGTPPGPYDREALAQDVIALLDACDVERAVLIGHSMGGIVAMSTAVAHPARAAGLVLLGTASQCSERVARWYERLAVAAEEEGLDGVARAIYGDRGSRSIAGDARGIAHVTRMLKTLFDDPLTPRLAEIVCPVLLLVGEKDPMGPKASEIIRAALPPALARLEVLSERGHWLHVEAPDRVIEALDRWLSDAL